MKKALLFGSSGFVGSYILQGLLGNPDYMQVTAVVRKDIGIAHAKLKTLTGAFQSLKTLAGDIAVDDAFIAIGTTRKKTPNRDLYYQIVHDYPVLAATTAKERGASSVFPVSAVGADAYSSVFYNRIRGEAERDVIALDFDHTHIFRPSVIMGERPGHRPLERVLILACGLINPMLAGKLRKFRGIKASDIARAMNAAAGRPAGKVHFYQWDEMNALLCAQ